MALRALRVVLDRGKMQQQLPPQVERDYLGGRGAIAWFLFNHLPKETAPLSAENLLVFAAGPLAGTSAFSSGGFVVGTRSPLTGGIGYSWTQGHWGAALRRSGHDVLVISGQAANWCYLQIDSENVRLRPATHLLGLDTRATVAALRAELGDAYVVACIGPAAEAEVAYSSIVAEGRYRAEPAGTGAVMAHKRLKAIAVRDGAPLPVADERTFRTTLELITKRVETSPLARGIRHAGSMYYFPRAVATGALTEWNGRHGHLRDEVRDLGTTLLERGFAAGRRYNDIMLPPRSAQTPRAGHPLPLPELETVAGFGAGCGITNPDTLITISDQCLLLGLDPVATGAAIAFMMECQQENLSPATTLPWGDDEAVLAAIERLGQHQEKRDVLSLGVDEMKEIFFGSANFAPQVKGLAMPALDPRALTEVALATATASIGGDYRYAMTYEELLEAPPKWLPEEAAPPRATKGKATRLIWHERFAAVLDAAGLCRRLGLLAYQVTPGEALALITAATGQPFSGADLARLGERIVSIERLFARRQCYHGTDELPARWRGTPLSEGPAAGHVPDLGALLIEYYRRHGWDREGNPTPERLHELGIRL